MMRGELRNSRWARSQTPSWVETMIWSLDFWVRFRSREALGGDGGFSEGVREVWIWRTCVCCGCWRLYIYEDGLGFYVLYISTFIHMKLSLDVRKKRGLCTSYIRKALLLSLAKEKPPITVRHQVVFWWTHYLDCNRCKEGSEHPIRIISTRSFLPHLRMICAPPGSRRSRSVRISCNRCSRADSIRRTGSWHIGNLAGVLWTCRLRFLWARPRNRFPRWLLLFLWSMHRGWTKGCRLRLGGHRFRMRFLLRCRELVLRALWWWRGLGGGGRVTFLAEGIGKVLLAGIIFSAQGAVWTAMIETENAGGFAHDL